MYVRKISKPDHVRYLSAGSGFILLGCIAYLAVVAKTGKGIPCLFYRFLGLKCPGCGMTRAAVSIVHGDLKAAAGYNIMSVTVMPALFVYLVYRVIREEGFNNKDVEVWEYFFFILIFMVAFFYTILRNFL